MDAPFLEQAVQTTVETITFLGMPTEKAAIVVSLSVGVASFIIGLFQCGLIGWGLWQMHRASNERDKQLDQQAERLNQQDRKLDQMDRKLDQQDKKLDQQLEALRILIERTAPQSPGTVAG